VFTFFATINWIDLINYPHFGPPKPGQYNGPPIVFIIINFIFFAWLFNKFILKGIAANIAKRHEDFVIEMEDSEKQFADSQTKLQNSIQRRTAIYKELEMVEKVVAQVGELEVQKIIGEANFYKSQRKKETLNQIKSNHNRLMKKIKFEIMEKIIESASSSLENVISEEEKTGLYENVLEKIVGEEDE
jgi:F0F1-type ATP synthase membrane subunit b/b'